MAEKIIRVVKREDLVAAVAHAPYKTLAQVAGGEQRKLVGTVNGWVEEWQVAKQNATRAANALFGGV